MTGLESGFRGLLVTVDDVTCFECQGGSEGRTGLLLESVFLPEEGVKGPVWTLWELLVF